jgi:hypothetical protein
LQCDEYRHLRPLGAVAVVIYCKIGHVTWSGVTQEHSEWWASIEAMAKYIGCDYKTCRLAFVALVKAGWLVKVESSNKNPFKSKKYRIVTHNQWVKNHPDQCYVREAMVWDGEQQDRLGVELYKGSGGKVKWYANTLTGVRKAAAGMPDDEIVRAFHDFIELLEPRPTKYEQWKSIPFKFIKELRARRAVTPHNVVQCQ